MLCRHPAPGHTPGRCREVRRGWDGEGADGAPRGKGATEGKAGVSLGEVEVSV